MIRPTDWRAVSHLTVPQIAGILKWTKTKVSRCILDESHPFFSARVDVAGRVMIPTPVVERELRLIKERAHADSAS